MAHDTLVNNDDATIYHIDENLSYSVFDNLHLLLDCDLEMQELASYRHIYLNYSQGSMPLTPLVAPLVLMGAAMPLHKSSFFAVHRVGISVHIMS